MGSFELNGFVSPFCPIIINFWGFG